VAVRPKLGRPARLGRIVSEVVVSGGGARTAADHAVRLGAQELRPAGADPARRRAEARAAQHRRDRGGRDADPELQQLTLDTHVAPARVLPRQPPDQAARLGRKRRTAGPATATSPTSLTQCPVPAAERLRADRKARPSLRREQPAHRSEQGPVDGRVLRPLPSAPEDRQLVAQHDGRGDRGAVGDRARSGAASGRGPRRRQVERAVRPVLVVVAAVDAETCSRWRRPRTRIRSRQSARSVRTRVRRRNPGSARPRLRGGTGAGGRPRLRAREASRDSGQPSDAGA
jgi:hypothetical protein